MSDAVDVRLRVLLYLPIAQSHTYGRVFDLASDLLVGENIRDGLHQHEERNWRIKTSWKSHSGAGNPIFLPLSSVLSISLILM